MSLENQMAELSSAVRVLTDHLQQVQQMLAKGAPVPAAEPAPEPKTKPAAKKVAKEKEPEPEPQQPDSPADPDKDAVIATLKVLQDAQGRQAVVDLLAKHGARNLSRLDPEKFEVVIAEAQEAAA